MHTRYTVDNEQLIGIEGITIQGLRITSFPYLLTMQLKRFDFDYTTFNRIKLNDRLAKSTCIKFNIFFFISIFYYDSSVKMQLNNICVLRVSFPDLLDLNPFVHKPEEKKEKKEDAE